MDRSRKAEKPGISYRKYSGIPILWNSMKRLFSELRIHFMLIPTEVWKYVSKTSGGIPYRWNSVDNLHSRHLWRECSDMHCNVGPPNINSTI
jgi:hypothetical protein